MGTPFDSEPLVRLAAFGSVFALMAAWEIAAPARALRLSRLARWRANLGLALFNTLLLRVALPGSAVALAALAAGNGWGLLNHVELPLWAAVALGAV
ncbi:MAG: sterol desaturase family protein, partial [Pseudomonadota bacterium]